jgi:predicted MFS family arabinose efflux permease
MTPTVLSRDERVLPALAVLGLAAFVVGTDVFVVAGMLPELSRSLAVSTHVAGYLIVAFSLTYALLAPLIASVTVRWPRSVALAAALGVLALGNAVCATTSLFAVALLGRAVAAVGAASFTPQAAAVGAALARPGRQGTALAIISTGFAAASAVGVPLGTFAAAVFGWRVSMGAVSALALLSAVGVFLALPPRLAPAQPHPLAERLRPLADRAVLLVTVTTLVAVVAEYIVYTYVSVVFAGATGGRGRVLAVLLLAFGVGGVATSVVVGPVIDRWSDRGVSLIAFAGMAVDLGFLPWSGREFGPAVVAMVAWGVTGWMYLAPQQHRLLRLAGSAGPLAVSLNSSAIYLGASLGAIVGGGLLSFIAARWLGLLAGVICVLAGVLSVCAECGGRAPIGEKGSG